MQHPWSVETHASVSTYHPRRIGLECPYINHAHMHSDLPVSKYQRHISTHNGR